MHRVYDREGIFVGESHDSLLWTAERSSSATADRRRFWPVPASGRWCSSPPRSAYALALERLRRQARNR